VPDIRLGHVVTAVKHQPGAVEVTCALTSDKVEGDNYTPEPPCHVTLRARRAIITLPLGVLKVNKWCTHDSVDNSCCCNALCELDLIYTMSVAPCI
jgi:hypothetical protein